MFRLSETKLGGNGTQNKMSAFWREKDKKKFLKKKNNRSSPLQTTKQEKGPN